MFPQDQNHPAARVRIDRAVFALLSVLLTVLLAGPAPGQSRPQRTFIVNPLPPNGFGDVQGSTRVVATLDGLILQVDCEQTFVNNGSRLQEVEILLPVPADAVVSNGLLMADGREYPAEVLPADEARRIYEEIVRRRRDPALIELAGHGLIRLSAFPIPPGGTRQVSFRYSQSLPARDGRLRLLFPVAALCGLNRVGPLDLSLAIDGREPLAQVYSPSHDIEIDRDGSTSARLHFAADRPDPHETLEVVAVRNEGPLGVDLRTADGYGENGYFLLAVSPGWELLSDRKRAPKTVLFVLDTSGSMEGEKFEQARRALRGMIREMSPEDRFNLIAFSSDVRSLFAGGPRRATGQARSQAEAWLDGLHATGGTAIADAIEEAYRQADRAGLVLFLTDGLPTVGEQDHDAIVRRAAGRGRSIRFYAFGVGYDVDATLLDDLARRGNGSVAYVRPGEDVEEAVTTLRRRVEYPCARNVEIRIAGARVYDLFPRGAVDLFAGEPLIFAGRVRPHAGRATVHLTADGPDGRVMRDSWVVDFEDPDANSSAVPVLWASRKAADLIEKIRREGHDPAALDELRELSRRYGILNEEVALLAREDIPMAEARLDAGAVTNQATGQLHFRGGRPDEKKMKVDTWGGAAPAPAPSSPPALAQREEVELSAKVWDLSDARSKDQVIGSDEAKGSVRTAAGITFRHEGDAWVDIRLDDPLPKGTEMIRVRPFGSAYFDLARGNKRLAEWLSLGERVRILLPGIVLEVIPDGEETLPAATIQRLITAAAKV